MTMALATALCRSYSYVRYTVRIKKKVIHNYSKAYSKVNWFEYLHVAYK